MTLINHVFETLALDYSADEDDLTKRVEYNNVVSLIISSYFPDQFPSVTV